ncbi:MAG: hypothetical protein PHW63_08955 [Alphaproteobacteria bacterium]|nr:hypothetical protein [Alphaproteobacteria bacterium]
MTTNHDLDQAREWADTIAQSPKFFDPGMEATARVIASLPGEWIDADELRKWMGNFIQEERTGTPHEWLADAFTSLQNTFLTPKPRTLADMDDEEREACRWMQAQIFHSASTVGCVVDPGDFRSIILFQDGAASNVDNDQITPLPDLPRMVWPDEHPATEEDVSIIPPEIDTSGGHDDFVDMTPEDAPDGYYLVRWWGEEYPTPAEKFQGLWWVIGRATMLPAKDVLIVSRLIPEGEQV